MVPQSYMLPGASSITVGWPTGSRGSSDVYEGVFRDTKVCVKQLRIYSNGEPDKATQVCYRDHLYPFASDEAHRLFFRRL